MDGDRRLYYRFRYAKFYGGIVTADAIGCNLLCAYCWNYNRNLHPERAKGEFLRPPDVASRIKTLMAKRKCDRYRISGCEPFLGRASALHVAEVVRLVGPGCIIETNGVMLGYDPSLLDLLKPLPLHIRLTIKGHNEIIFEKVTGAKAEGLAYQFKAVEARKGARIRFSVAVMPQFVDWRSLPFSIDVEEDLIEYGGTRKRLISRGL